MKLNKLNERLNMSLPIELLNEIIFESQYETLKKRNMEYNTWGHAILEAAYAIYLYNNDRKRITHLINGYCIYLQDAIFEKLNLDEYIVFNEKKQY